LDGPAPILIEVPDIVAGIPATGRHRLYEDLVAAGDAAFKWIMPQDEWESLALNYTSGTTGRPKGVVYHHRGAYLATMGNQISWRMTLFPVMLQIVPLFHCNNWTHTWMMPLLGGTAVCCRDITAAAIYAAITDQGVTHFGGAPIVLNLIVNAADADRRAFDHTVEVFTAGAPPAAALLAAVGKLGFNITQVYGLTETYGPATECIWNTDWDALPEDEQSAIKARQGVLMPMMDDIFVVDDAMQPVPRDGATQGEIVMRGNAVMKGYYRNTQATKKAFAGGYFHTEDLAVQHPGGYIQITDRAKDIIISGGENISSVEVESALMHHAAVSLCAVVAQPDDKWGEVPCAFIELKSGRSATAEELIVHTRSRLAGFKCPKRIVFCELPKTSTGKIQKFELRALAARTP
jgi:fatty-acyl-CoA synthase